MDSYMILDSYGKIAVVNDNDELRYLVTQPDGYSHSRISMAADGYGYLPDLKIPIEVLIEKIVYVDKPQELTFGRVVLELFKLVITGLLILHLLGVLK